MLSTALVYKFYLGYLFSGTDLLSEERLYLGGRGLLILLGRLDNLQLYLIRKTVLLWAFDQRISVQAIHVYEQCYGKISAT